MRKSSWFDIDKDGLAQLTQRNGYVWILHELMANAWDEKSTVVEVTLEPIPGRSRCKLVVKDDNPDGFRRISDAYTLFAPSTKKNQPLTRGQFNLGEKLVLALCESADIISTTGSIKFRADGKRVVNRGKMLEAGTIFSATLKINRDQMDEVSKNIWLVIPPSNIRTTYNGNLIPTRSPVSTFTGDLPTVAPDNEGIMRNTKRECPVLVYDLQPGETGTIYEQGIPVVQTGDPFHINVMQKVPLNMERNNVTPSFLRQLRTQTLTHTAHLLTETLASSIMVQEATNQPDCDKDALSRVIKLRFGDNSFIPDPNDPESTKTLVSRGQTPVWGGSLSGETWANVKRHNLLPTSSFLAPTPTPYSVGGRPEVIIPRADWTSGMVRVNQLAIQLGYELMNVRIDLRYVNEPKANWVANYCKGGRMAINIAAIRIDPLDALEGDRLVPILDLILHELAHEYCGDHLNSAYHEALTMLGAKAVALALTKPNAFK